MAFLKSSFFVRSVLQILLMASSAVGSLYAFANRITPHLIPPRSGIPQAGIIRNQPADIPLRLAQVLYAIFSLPPPQILYGICRAYGVHAGKVRRGCCQCVDTLNAALAVMAGMIYVIRHCDYLLSLLQFLLSNYSTQRPGLRPFSSAPRLNPRPVYPHI